MRLPIKRPIIDFDMLLFCGRQNKSYTIGAPPSKIRDPPLILIGILRFQHIHVPYRRSSGPSLNQQIDIRYPSRVLSTVRSGLLSVTICMH